MRSNQNDSHVQREVKMSLPASIQFQRRLKALREKRGLSQEKLAELAGLSTRTIFNYEKGRHNPRPDHLHAIAKAMRISMTELCPFFTFTNLKELLHDRLDGEVKSMGAFVEYATPVDLERLELLLEVYKRSTGMAKLEIDFVIHRTITSFGGLQNQRKVNTLILQFFSQIDEFVEQSGLLSPYNEEVLGTIHLQLVKAALDKDLDKLLDVYMLHQRASEEFVFTSFGLDGRELMLTTS